MLPAGTEREGIVRKAEARFTSVGGAPSLTSAQQVPPTAPTPNVGQAADRSNRGQVAPAGGAGVAITFQVMHSQCADADQRAVVLADRTVSVDGR